MRHGTKISLRDCSSTRLAQRSLFLYVRAVVHSVRVRVNTRSQYDLAIRYLCCVTPDVDAQPRHLDSSLASVQGWEEGPGFEEQRPKKKTKKKRSPLFPFLGSRHPRHPTASRIGERLDRLIGSVLWHYRPLNELSRSESPRGHRTTWR